MLRQTPPTGGYQQRADSRLHYEVDLSASSRSQQVLPEHDQVKTGALQPSPASETHGGQRLGSFLCWAVVFADIGTSIYYVPGILYGQVNRLAGLFVLMTMIVFLLLVLKYAEVSVRFPEG